MYGVAITQYKSPTRGFGTAWYAVIMHTPKHLLCNSDDHVELFGPFNTEGLAQRKAREVAAERCLDLIPPCRN